MSAGIEGGTTALTRFVALGDSTTEGLGDPLPGGGWRGWAVLLAEALGQVAFTNLAVSGATSRLLRDEQLGPALALRPAIASVLVGINDTLRGGFDPDRIGADVDHTVSALTSAGAIVLTARMPDPGRMFGLPGVLSRPLSRRTHALNAVVDQVAARHGTLHLDLAGHPSTYDRMMWSVDRLHPSERGHRLVARGFGELLLRSGWPLPALPSAEPSGGAEATAWGHAWWLATRGTTWVAERCTDLVPSLVAMAAREASAGFRVRAVREPWSGGAREPWSAIRAGGAGPTTLQVHDPT
jgi:lysophospholipase L1-like esterase